MKIERHATCDGALKDHQFNLPTKFGDESIVLLLKAFESCSSIVAVTDQKTCQMPLPLSLIHQHGEGHNVS